MNNLKILVITPTSHLNKVNKILDSIPLTQIIYLPECTNGEFKNHSDCTAIFTNPNKSKVFLGRENLKNFNKLKFICTASTGTVHIDKEFCREKEIEIISLTEERSVINKIPSTAEHAFALMLSAIRNIPESITSVRNGNWDYEPFIGRQIKDLTIGVIGYGRLGTFFANYCDAFGSQVIVYDPYKDVNHPRICQCKSLDELTIKSDVVSLHVHVTKETTQMINHSFLKNCKTSLILINTSRGEIINEEDLLLFLKNNKSSKYATDVLSSEINGTANNLIKKYSNNNPNQAIITPHIGGMTKEAQNMAFGHAAYLLKDALVSSNY